MKTIKKGLFLLLAALFLTSAAYAQKSIAQKADNLFDQNQFVEALKAYEKAYEKTLTDIRTDVTLNSQFDKVSHWGGFVLLD